MNNLINLEIRINLEELICAMERTVASFMCRFSYDERTRIIMYIVFSLGGTSNVWFYRKHGNEIWFFFRDFSKVNRDNFKNLGARVFICESRACMVLKPNYNATPRICSIFDPELFLDDKFRRKM